MTEDTPTLGEGVRRTSCPDASDVSKVACGPSAGVNSMLSLLAGTWLEGPCSGRTFVVRRW